MIKVPDNHDNLHKGSKGSHDIEEMVNNSKCSKQYFAFEDCLGEYDRNFSKCQDQIRILKLCWSNKTS